MSEFWGLEEKGQEQYKKQERHLYFNGQRTRVDEERTDEMERIKLQSRGRDSKSPLHPTAVCVIRSAISRKPGGGAEETRRVGFFLSLSPYTL